MDLSPSLRCNSSWLPGFVTFLIFNTAPIHPMLSKGEQMERGQLQSFHLTGAVGSGPGAKASSFTAGAKPLKSLCNSDAHAFGIEFSSKKVVLAVLPPCRGNAGWAHTFQHFADENEDTLIYVQHPIVLPRNLAQYWRSIRL